MKTNRSTFQTAAGQIIYTTAFLLPGIAAAKAIRRALELGVNTLYAVEPDGRTTNYTPILRNRIERKLTAKTA